MPRDGEMLGVFVYNAWFNGWIYPAAYDTAATCQRRAEHLQTALGIPFYVGVTSDWASYYAVTWSRCTAADLRAALAPAPIWGEDTAAHVAETVDELRRDRPAPER